MSLMSQNYFVNMPKRPVVMGTEVIHQNPWWSYKRDQIQYPSGKIGEYYYVETPGAALTVPLTDDGKLVLVRQLRYLTGKLSLEFPMGGIKPPESPIEAAKRELLEETGYSARDVVQLGTCEPSNGVLRDTTSIFLAHTLTPGTPVIDEAEEVEVVLRRPDEFEEFVLRGEITDGQTLSAWALARNHIYKLTS